MKKMNWTLQLCRIQDKGYQAFKDNIPITDNPYLKGHHNQNGNGGQLQRQRRIAWRRGWEEAQKKSKED